MTRRDVVRLGGASIAAAVTAGLSGCSGIPLSGGDGGASGLSAVPQGVSAVARGDVTATLEDSAVTTFVDEVLGLLAQQESYTGPTEKSGVLERFSEETDLDPNGAETAVGYTTYPEPETPASTAQYAGLVLEADWSEGAVIDALETTNYAFTEGSYEGRTVYEPDREYQTLWVGVTGSDSYALGTESAVTDAIDVAEGNLESVGGDLEEAYDGVRSAPFRFASAVPASMVPTESTSVGGSSVELSQFTAVDHVAGATYHDGDTVGIRVELLTGGSDDAEDVRNILAGAASAGEDAIEDETLQGALDDVSVSQDGSTVVAEVSGPVDRAAEVIEATFRTFLGF